MVKVLKKKVSVEMVIYLFLFVGILLLHSKSGIANDLGTSLVSTFDSWLGFAVKVFRYIAIAAIIGGVIAALSGRASWTIFVIIVFCSVIVANIDIIADKLGLTKGLLF